MLSSHTKLNLCMNDTTLIQKPYQDAMNLAKVIRVIKVKGDC